MDRRYFETITKNVSDFLDSFCNKLVALKKHSFIAHQQSEYYQNLKESIKEDDAVVSLEFSKNSSFVVQDEAQSFDWNTNQATIHSFAVYYKARGEIKYKSCVFISRA